MSPPRRDPPSASEINHIKTLIGPDGVIAELDEDARYPCLTILYHPDLRRVGEQAVLSALMVGRADELSRLSPRFAAPGALHGHRLRDPFLSRRPIRFEQDSGGIAITPQPGVVLEVNDEPVTTRHLVPESALDQGVILQLSRRVLLLLHRLPLPGARAPYRGLIGDSERMLELRQQIEQVADLDVPVLIRGETGVGKERVAQSIHQASKRARRDMVAVNMAAIAETTALSELFGHVKGAFTGAVARHTGLFERAHGSSLFLDEIGDTPGSIQAMLLRALAEGTIRPVGARRDIRVDARIIAATDADLEQAGDEGGFRSALLFRLAGFVIRVPPLRERRDDIPRLIVHFLEEELSAYGESWRLTPLSDTAQRLWFPPALMVRLYRHDWPGNVRQLRNAVRQIVIASRGADVVCMDASVERVLSGLAGLAEESGPLPQPLARADFDDEPNTEPEMEATPMPITMESIPLPDVVAPPPAPAASIPAPVASPPAPVASTPAPAAVLPAPDHSGSAAASPPRPQDLKDAQIFEAMRACQWRVNRAAAMLGIARTTLYELIDKHPDLRRSTDIPDEELIQCHRECGGDLDMMVDRLRVSKRGLKLRMRSLDAARRGGAA